MSDPAVLVIEMQGGHPGGAPCYECEAGNHAACLGVPCGCPCPALSAAGIDPAAPVIEPGRYPAFGHAYEYRVGRPAEAGSVACEGPCPVPAPPQGESVTPPLPPAGEVETPTGGWTRSTPSSPGWVWFWGSPLGWGRPRLYALEVLDLHGVGLVCDCEGDEMVPNDFGRGWWHPLAPPSVEGLEL